MKRIEGLERAITTTAIFGLFAGIPFAGGACSRVIYKGLNNTIIVGRSLDWKTPIPTNLYVYPRGITKKSSNRPGAFSWTSRYGAVYAVGYDGGVTEGMNEKGLVINGLFCKGTIYVNEKTKNRPPMSMACFVEWLLDMNSTTDEVCALLSEQNFSLGGATFDNGTTSALHWGITDATGKSAILEFNNGNIKLYYPDNYYAMTNDPQWPQMIAILDYWDNIGGSNMLPGTVKSADRCVRANFFAHNVEKTDNPDLALSITRSILANVSVPYKYSIEGEPNLSSTQWRSYADINRRRYYFDIVTNLGIYYIDLSHCDLRQGADILKLDTQKYSEILGNANKYLKHSNGFNPMY